MPKSTTCSVESCNRAIYARGWCQAHYKRVQVHGDLREHIPLKILPTKDERPDIVGRISAKCTIDESGCITWRGMVNRSGYGTISWGSRQWMVHRAMWTATVGPIPEGIDWTIDHLCFNTSCVNPDHLEVVTRAENSLRGTGVDKARIRNASVTHCKNGHEFTEENTAWTSMPSRRICLACKREAWARTKDKIAAKRRAAYAEARAAGATWQDARLASIASK